LISSEPNPKHRLASLDYLRGLSALGIMIYHYVMWNTSPPGSASFLGRTGIYGVVVFYILSGITLYHVYNEQIGSPSRTGLIKYFSARFFRIYPLLWLLSVASIIIKKEDFSLETKILNYTGLFSVYHWADTLCYGAWSIGNELVFYLFFPVFIFLSKWSKPLFAALSGGLLLIFLWFTFRVMNSAKPLSDYWVQFLNPLNQVQLFLGGYLIAYFTKKLVIPLYFTLLLILLSIFTFVYYPASGDTMALVSGINRIVFCLICLLLSFSVYKIAVRLPGPLHFIFGTLGEISYSLYLLHPIVAYIFPRLFRSFSIQAHLASLCTSFGCTIVLSFILYRFYERPFMKLGKFVSRKMTSDSQK